MRITFHNHIASYNVWRLGRFWKYHLPKSVATLYAYMVLFMHGIEALAIATYN